MSEHPYAAYSVADNDCDEQVAEAVREIMAARPRFKTGDRVQWIGFECPEYHGVARDGATGTVGSRDHILWGEPSSPGHDVLVWWDQPIISKDGVWQLGIVAAPDELIRIDEARS